MRFDSLTLKIEGPIAELRVRAGAPAARLLEDLERAADAISDALDVRCVLLTAERWTFEPCPAERSVTPLRFLEELRAPVIAVIEGDCHAEALEVALACDVRIAGATATFAMPQLTQDRLPSLGGTQRLLRLIGRTHAVEMLLLGDKIDAETALARGLVNAVTPASEARARAASLAATIAERGPIAVQLAKEALLRGLDLPLDAALRYETDLTVILQTTADRAEGVRAFVEKRPPKFEGK